MTSRHPLLPAPWTWEETGQLRPGWDAKRAQWQYAQDPCHHPGPPRRGPLAGRPPGGQCGAVALRGGNTQEAQEAGTRGHPPHTDTLSGGASSALASLTLTGGRAAAARGRQKEKQRVRGCAGRPAGCPTLLRLWAPGHWPGLLASEVGGGPSARERGAASQATRPRGPALP